ncbi:MAG: hypothetical protein A2381_18990 [Bdellovibrionales bacterium RIFOXYB1_FULL_37_110]|nr:MAG: hypothetical protein A2417_13110 [Bdellovibrionales bacterium RIFOXYC1_FULL_37_79]OFZ59879.1 MAG: hypothetical protein A2381_18990 [Bdellovibrionales bacterium RIFOXYB1_FULL_37_110]OFZ63500.1 MAG: hypothetical protein A2577_06440 [Bdellovibrionales bacterium RIFOXYD1_FULL_36_51]
MNTKNEIIEIVNRETWAWDNQNVEQLLSIFHEEMVWPWPPDSKSHDPMTWVLEQGKFNYDRWSEIYNNLFENYNLVHNKREIKKIEVSKENDGAFAVVDIDTLWRNSVTNKDFLWKGRTCKIYSKTVKG